MAKRIWISLIVLLSVAFFLPQIGSTFYGKRKIEAHLETLLGGSVAIERISLSWWGNQRCHQVKWSDESNGISLTASTVNIQANLIDCLKYKENPLDVLVEGAKIACAPHKKFLKVEGQMELAFSPIRALVQKGAITIERTEIKVSESMKVITWGTIDLDGQQMDMTLGLPQKTLKKLFKVKNLPEEFLLEIPISSKLSMRALEKKLISSLIKNYAMVGSL